MSDAQLIENTTIPPGSTFGDSCVIKNCTIMSKSTFGVGCIFESCTFTCTPGQDWSTVGDGAVFTDSTLNCVSVGADSVLNNTTLGAHSLGANAAINSPPTNIGSEITLLSEGGAEIAINEKTTDFCANRCEVGGFNIGNDGTLISVNGGDAGSGATLS